MGFLKRLINVITWFLVATNVLLILYFLIGTAWVYHVNPGAYHDSLMWGIKENIKEIGPTSFMFLLALGVIPPLLSYLFGFGFKWLHKGE